MLEGLEERSLDAKIYFRRYIILLYSPLHHYSESLVNLSLTERKKLVSDF